MYCLRQRFLLLPGWGLGLSGATPSVGPAVPQQCRQTPRMPVPKRTGQGAIIPAGQHSSPHTPAPAQSRSQRGHDSLPHRLSPLGAQAGGAWLPLSFLFPRVTRWYVCLHWSHQTPQEVREPGSGDESTLGSDSSLVMDQLCAPGTSLNQSLCSSTCSSIK